MTRLGPRPWKYVHGFDTVEENELLGDHARPSTHTQCTCAAFEETPSSLQKA